MTYELKETGISLKGGITHLQNITDVLKRNNVIFTWNYTIYDRKRGSTWIHCYIATFDQGSHLPDLIDKFTNFF